MALSSVGSALSLGLLMMERSANSTITPFWLPLGGRELVLSYDVCDNVEWNAPLHIHKLKQVEVTSNHLALLSATACVGLRRHNQTSQLRAVVRH